MSSEAIIEPHDPRPDCDCKACAIAERDALRAHLASVEQWYAEGERLLQTKRFGLIFEFFKLGVWWGERPWRCR